ncbi:MAG: hypothetical protein U9P80_06320 [Thermodesulfobacteriota bacterium]|nr:hypothetical protein [Thermodesulfobacteriota bacterium]
MSYRCLSKKEAQIIKAMGSGIIPSGGSSFEVGAAELSEKWLPRTDYMLSRMPFMTRFGLRAICHVLNYGWPLVFMRNHRPMTSMDERELTEMFHFIEHSPFPGPLSILIVKVLVFPAFYGLDEVKDAIGYHEKFPNSPDFEGLKD